MKSQLSTPPPPRTGCRFLGWGISFISISTLVVYCLASLVISLAVTEASAVVELQDRLEEHNLPDCARLIRLFGQTETIRSIIAQVNGALSKISANYILSPDLTAPKSSSITKEGVDNTFKLYEFAVRQRWGGLNDEITWQIEKQSAVTPKEQTGISIDLLKFLHLKTSEILSEEELQLKLENKKKLLNESRRAAIDQQFLIRRALSDYLGLDLSEHTSSPQNSNQLPQVNEKEDSFMGTHYQSGILAGLPVIPKIPDQISNFDQLTSLASQLGINSVLLRKKDLEAKVLQLHLTYQPTHKLLQNFEEENLTIEKSIQESNNRIKEAQSKLHEELQANLTHSVRTLFGLNFSNPLIKLVTKVYTIISSQTRNPN
jgi:hypothetical protein